MLLIRQLLKCYKVFLNFNKTRKLRHQIPIVSGNFPPRIHELIEKKIREFVAKNKKNPKPNPEASGGFRILNI